MIVDELLHEPHIKPLGGQVVLLPVYRETEIVGGFDTRVSEGGIALPDTVENDPIEGIVVALGEGHVEACPTCFPNGKTHVFSVKLSDKVLFCPWLCVTVIVDEKEFYITHERDILGIRA